MKRNPRRKDKQPQCDFSEGPAALSTAGASLSCGGWEPLRKGLLYVKVNHTESMMFAMTNEPRVSRSREAGADAPENIDTQNPRSESWLQKFSVWHLQQLLCDFLYSCNGPFSKGSKLYYASCEPFGRRRRKEEISIFVVVVFSYNCGNQFANTMLYFGSGWENLVLVMYQMVPIT